MKLPLPMPLFILAPLPSVRTYFMEASFAEVSVACPTGGDFRPHR